ncbi:hypothetical protein [Natrinema pallidum]|uniref:hypothetical protein n=1 Tax=Natrinema pallidum TaxID=69527 RepID=UPI0037517E4F
MAQSVIGKAVVAMKSSYPVPAAGPTASTHDRHAGSPWCRSGGENSEPPVHSSTISSEQVHMVIS